MSATSIAAEQKDVSCRRARHSSNNPRTLMHHAEMAQSGLWQFTAALTEFLNLDPSTQAIRGPLKLRDRFISKARGKYGGQFSEVPDLVRNRVLFNEPETIYLFRSLTGPGKGSHPFLLEWEKRGIRVTEIDDAFLDRKKSGYVGINISVEIDLGKGRWHTCEIQLMHENMQDVDKDTKYTYDNYIRPITDVAEAEGRDLTQEESDSVASFREANKNMYDGAILANGLTGLLSRTAFSDLMERLGHDTKSKPTQARNLKVMAA